MWGLYTIAAAPLCIWALLWARSRKIALGEAIGGTAAGIVCCLVFQVVAVLGMTADVETWSGRVTSARFDPSYTEWYMQMHTRTVGSGKNRHTEVYWTRETRRVPDKWSCRTELGSGESISKGTYEKMVSLFGGATRSKDLKDSYDSGDPWTYQAFSTKTGYVWPCVETHYWENRVKATPSLFSFAEVPEGAPVYEYPKNPRWDRSGRLLGTAKSVDIYAWDQMNARLGPTKWVNVLAIGFGDKDASVAQLQQAKWIGGKQNDLVLCFGGPNEKPTWAYVFGWSEREVAKRDLETILLDHGFTEATLPLIEAEIVANYQIKDFGKFDYLTVEPPAWSYGVLLGVIAVSQVLLGFWFFQNEFDKDSGKTVRRYRYGRYRSY